MIVDVSGELFDHGFDSSTVSLQSIASLSALGTLSMKFNPDNNNTICKNKIMIVITAVYMLLLLLRIWLFVICVFLILINHMRKLMFIVHLYLSSWLFTWLLGGLVTFPAPNMFWLYFLVLFSWTIAHGEKYTTSTWKFITNYVLFFANFTYL